MRKHGKHGKHGFLGLKKSNFQFNTSTILLKIYVGRNMIVLY